MIKLIDTNIGITSKYSPPKRYLKLKIIICSPKFLQSMPLHKFEIYEMLGYIFLGRKLLIMSVNGSKMKFTEYAKTTLKPFVSTSFIII